MILEKLKYFFLKNNVDDYNFLVFFRISLGLFLGTHLLSIIGDIDLLYGTESIISEDIQTFGSSKYISYNNISNFLNINYPFYKKMFIAVYLCLCLSISLGFFSRVSALCLLFFQISIFRTFVFYIYGVDLYSSIALMYVVLLPSDDYYSIRYIMNRNINKGNLTPFKKLFQIHLCIAYFFSGLQKILGYNWWNGEAVWKAINLPNFYNEFNLEYDNLAKYPLLFVIAGWSVIIIELLYFIFINMKITRKIWLFLTISMHLFILITLNLFFFSTLMIILNLTNYYYENNTIHTH